MNRKFVSLFNHSGAYTEIRGGRANSILNFIARIKWKQIPRQRDREKKRKRKINING